MLKLKHLDGALAQERQLESSIWKAANAAAPRRRRSSPLVNVRKALKEADHRPLDAYRLARLTGHSVHECGGALTQLEARGAASSEDPSGSINDLARRFTLLASS